MPTSDQRLIELRLRLFSALLVSVLHLLSLLKRAAVLGSVWISVSPAAADRDELLIVHEDGGMLINNPTALAIHECQCLWPDVPLQCVVSLGTGRFETAGRSSVSYTSLKTKLTNVISSATDTEVKILREI
ncbi:calcium-independent phospholipase A2-gamma-like protein [Labeo rohita]|uniref:Calcium-independent phospholipase A2-gamma-like protein n=1 Tax=Labeo rohita TaxID=84645 RepID=A0A498L8N1_LABRO|nr:calcium-independent phospholipase A2-gamma-like protein [Labeo rohita]